LDPQVEPEDDEGIVAILPIDLPLRQCHNRSWLAQEGAMTRKFIDCREFPSESNCSVTIMADTEDELLAAAVQHAVAIHRHDDTPELRAGLREVMRNGTPPEQVHRR
jgi:hypothetical protein